MKAIVTDVWNDRDREAPAGLIAGVLEALGRAVASVRRIGSGRNSRVYRVDCEDGARYAAKMYFDDEAGTRRLGAEFDGLGLLWREGERAIPQPVHAEPGSCWALYEYIEGEPAPRRADEAAVDEAIAFALRLRELAGRDGGGAIGPAAEACFSVRAILDNIRSRLDRLLALEGIGGPHKALHRFLIDEFVPAFQDIEAHCEGALREQGLSLDTEIGHAERTLSPSDFGFHNAIRRPSGEIVFLDFEYFGWDDPAKMISDFLLHPAMELSEALKRRFFVGAVSGFEGRGRLEKRVQIVYPLFGLKWCMILLNEFVPERADRRDFARGQPGSRRETQLRQLAMAEEMLQRTLREYQSFPYST